MTRPNRIEFPGAFYHVFARGNNKQKIFQDTQDYNIYLDRLERYHNRYDFILYAYALMSNHFHVAIETSEIPLSKIMQGMQQSYVQYFNKKYGSVGRLFQGPYRAVLYEKEESALNLVRYIHRNPIEACIVENPVEYPWCSHSAYLDLSVCSFLNKKSVLEMFPCDDVKAVQMFHEFVLDGPQSLEQLNFEDVKDRQDVGSNIFIENVKTKIGQSSNGFKIDFNSNLSEQRKKALSEILNIVSKQTKVSADSILGQSRIRTITETRRIFAFISAKYAGYSTVEISRFLNKDASSITCMIKKLELELAHNHILFEKIKEIIHVFNVWPRNED